MNAQELLYRIRKLNVLIVGDICLDRWCTYDPGEAEPSRETGIPRIAVVQTETTPGAGGTIANNVAALGVKRVSVLGAIGEDGHGYELVQALTQRDIRSDLLVKSTEFSTFTYTKLVNGRTGCEDLPRVDFINTQDIPRRVESELLRRLSNSAPDFDVVLVSDQAETEQGGCVTEQMRKLLSALPPHLVVWVDSRMRAEHFRGVILKPNRSEAEAACLRALGAIDFPRFREYTSAPSLVVTEGSNGARIYDDSGETHVPARTIEEPVDICGAGDSFSAGAALALAATGSKETAVRFGNIVASITVMKPGTGTASPEEVIAAEKDWPA